MGEGGGGGGGAGFGFPACRITLVRGSPQRRRQAPQADGVPSGSPSPSPSNGEREREQEEESTYDLQMNLSWEALQTEIGGCGCKDFSSQS